MQVDSLSALVSQIPLINFVFLGANTFMMTTVKLAIQELKTKIALDRRSDSESMQKWVKEEIASSAQHFPASRK